MGELSTTARKKLLARSKKTIRDVDSTVGAAAWDLGDALRAIEDNELWREDGATSFTAWLDTELEISRRSASAAILLARHFTREMAARYGGRKCAAAIAYAQLTRRTELPGDIEALSFRVRGDDGQYKSVPFAEVSARAIERMCADLRAEHAARDAQALLDAQPAEVKVQAAQANVRAIAVQSAVPAARVVARTSRDGVVRYEFVIPDNDMATFITALQGQFFPDLAR